MGLLTQVQALLTALGQIPAAVTAAIAALQTFSDYLEGA